MTDGRAVLVWTATADCPGMNAMVYQTGEVRMNKGKDGPKRWE